MYYYATPPSTDEIYHHGIKGMRWGVRRYENPDGSLTPAGKRKYINKEGQKIKSNRQRRKWAKEQYRDLVTKEGDLYLARKKAAENYHWDNKSQANYQKLARATGQLNKVREQINEYSDYFDSRRDRRNKAIAGILGASSLAALGYAGKKYNSLLKDQIKKEALASVNRTKVDRVKPDIVKPDIVQPNYIIPDTIDLTTLFRKKK